MDPLRVLCTHASTLRTLANSLAVVHCRNPCCMLSFWLEPEYIVTKESPAMLRDYRSSIAFTKEFNEGPVVDAQARHIEFLLAR